MFREVRPGIFIFVALALVVGTIGGCEPGVQKEPISLLPGRVVAIVNGEEITEGELAQRILPGERKKTVLDRMIDEMLISQAAAKARIKVDEKEIAQRLKMEIVPLPGEKISPMMRAKISHQFKMEIVIEKLYGRDIKISEKEMKAFFEANKDKLAPPQIRARHIAVGTRAEAENILKQLRAEADFAALAKERSIDNLTKDKGGELGFITGREFGPEFYKAVSVLDKGQISGVISDPMMGGYEIVQVIEKKPAKEAIYGEVKEEIRQSIFKEKVEERKQRSLSNLRREAKIEIKMPEAEVPRPK